MGNAGRLKRSHIFNEGDRVSIVVGSSSYCGEVTSDEGGRHISIEVDHLGNIDIFHSMVSVENSKESA